MGDYVNSDELIQHYRKGVDSALNRFFSLQKKRAGNIPDFADEILEHISEFTLSGGKRIRPVFFILGYKLVGGKNEKEIIKASIAFELMHSFFLVHDDIIDEDNLRRGNPTIHTIFEKKCRAKFGNKNSSHYGTSMAILAGDLLAVLASDILLNAEFPRERKIKALYKFNRVMANTIFGEILDTQNSFSSEIDEEEIMVIHRLKTAAYTVEGPLQTGAILGGADISQLHFISRFAIPLGRAFQIRDDILGMFGSKKVIGKPVNSDIKQGKKTLLLLKAVEKADQAQKKFLMSCVGDEKVLEKDIKKVRLIVKETGSLDYSINLSNQLVDHSKSIIKKSKLRKEGKRLLLWLADYLNKRKY